MSFTIEEFRDLVRLLEERPEWRVEIRRLVLTDELLSLPEQVAELRLRSERQFQKLREAHQRLAEQVKDLAEAQKRTEARLETLVDVIVRGKRPQDGAEVYLVVEVSWGVGSQDIGRAVQRAALLERAETLTIPVVAGRRVTTEAARLAQTEQVWQLTEGYAVPPASSSSPSSSDCH